MEDDSPTPEIVEIDKRIGSFKDDPRRDRLVSGFIAFLCVLLVSFSVSNQGGVGIKIFACLAAFSIPSLVTVLIVSSTFTNFKDGKVQVGVDSSGKLSLIKDSIIILFIGGIVAGLICLFLFFSFISIFAGIIFLLTVLKCFLIMLNEAYNEMGYEDGIAGFVAWYRNRKEEEMRDSNNA